MSVKDSKFLSLVLRHQPEKIGLVLDPHGWVEVDALLTQLAAHHHPLSREQLFEIVATNDKKRFTLSDDRRRIRAAQGHSVQIDLSLKPQIPPAQLFHGTAEKSLDAILRQGLSPRSRQQVHLSADQATAIKVGQRHGTPVVLVVDSGAMHGAGHQFYQAENGVWLTDHVPPEFLTPPDAAS